MIHRCIFISFSCMVTPFFFRFVIGCGQKIISSLKNFGLCYSHHHFAMVGDCLGEQGWVIRFQDFSSSFSSCKKLPSVEDSWRLCRGDVVIRMWSTIFFFGFVLFLGRRGKNTKLARTIQIDGLSVNSFFFLVELPHWHNQQLKDENGSYW